MKWLQFILLFVTLSWCYPEAFENGVSFNVYQSTDLTNWMLRTNVPGSARSLELPLEPGPHFFAMTASNEWGESAFATTTP